MITDKNKGDMSNSLLNEMDIVKMLERDIDVVFKDLITYIKSLLNLLYYHLC